MADFDSKLPIRSLAADNTTEVADSTGATINPAEEFAQASTTSGQKGPLAQGAVTTAAPTYTTGQTDPLSLTTAGSLRVDGSGATQPVSGTVTANAGTGVFDVDVEQIGNSALTLGQKTMANSIPVVIASDQSAITVTTAAITETAPDYKKATAIAANASDTHSFTPGSTISLDKITASASGQLKVEVQWGTTGAETSKWVCFTSKGNLFAELELPNPVSIPNTSTIKVIVTNFDNQAMDLYSSIIYH